MFLRPVVQPVVWPAHSHPRGPVGGGGGPALATKPTAYSQDFAGITDNTLLRNLPGWSAYNSTSSTNADRDAWQVVGGQAVCVNQASASNAGNFVIGRDTGSTDHVLRMKYTANGTNFFQMVVGATDQANCLYLNVFNDHASCSLSMVSAGTNTDFTSFNVTTGTPVARNITPADILELRLLGTKLAFVVNGVVAKEVDIGSFTKGSKVGLGTAFPVNYAIDDFYHAPLAAQVTVNDTQVFWPGKIGQGRSIPFTGAYTGATPTGLQYRVLNAATGAVVLDWTNGSNVVAAGNTWSANFQVPMADTTTNKQFVVKVRPHNDPDGIGACATPFTVGLGWVSYGQSNSQNRGSQPAGTPLTHASAYTFSTNTGGAWVGSSASATDTLYPGMAWGSTMAAKLGIPVGVFIGGHSARAIDELTATDAAGSFSGNFEWPEFITQATQCNMPGYAYGMNWTQGEAEANTGGSFLSAGGISTGNRTTYRNLFLNKVVANFRSQVAAVTTAPVLVDVIGQYWSTTGADATYGNSNWSYQRETLAGLAGIATNVFMSSSLMDIAHDPLSPVDPFHYSRDGYEEMNRRSGLSAAKALAAIGIGSYAGQDGRGPFVTGATRSGAVITLAVNLNGASSISGTGLTNYEVSTDNFATVKTISSVAVSGSTIVITLSANPGAVVQVRSFYGYWPESVTGATTASNTRTSTRAIGTYADATTIPVEPIYTALTSN